MPTLREILESQVTIPASIESMLPQLPKVSSQMLSFARGIPIFSLPLGTQTLPAAPAEIPPAPAWRPGTLSLVPHSWVQVSTRKVGVLDVSQPSGMQVSIQKAGRDQFVRG